MGLFETLTKPIKNLNQLNHAHIFIRIHPYRGLEFGCLQGAELRRSLEVLIGDLHALKVQCLELQNLEICLRAADTSRMLG